VAWPWLGVRRWGDCSRHPPCRGGAQWLPGDLSRHGPFHKKEVLFRIQARKMQILLPDLIEVLQKGEEHIKTKALVVIQNTMNGLKKTEASPLAVQLAEKLLPLFDEVRLMGQPEPCRWALGKGSCPSAQPNFSLAAAPRAPRAAQLHCGAGPDVLPRPQGNGLRLSRWSMARRRCRGAALQAPPQPVRGELFSSMAGAAGGECWVSGRAL